MNPFTKHPRSTSRPQGYWEHGIYSIKSGCWLIWLGVAGIIHGLFPWWLPFTTANGIMTSFQALRTSHRHDDRLVKRFGDDVHKLRKS